ncbi:MAG: ParB/RepB/Spo0J family partition protein [Deltaproteobacteria bacterium]|nr:ParB/RepB/Spo0J family partition protein [Deltaproteobacteria bacterium]
MTKKVLGRGLSALIGDVAPVQPAGLAGQLGVLDGKGQKGNFMLCPIDSIRPNRNQPRKKFEVAALQQLADSIREKGIIEPLVIRRDSIGHTGPANRYELIAGERRWRAAGLVGLKEVPAVIVDATDEECLELAIIENIQREDLNPIEEAEAYQSLVSFGLSQEEIAKKVGKDRATVANYLRLLRLPPEVKDELVNSSITMGHARAILSLEGHQAQRELCKKTIQKGFSVRETERLAARWLGGGVLQKKKSSIHLGPIEDDLRRIFSTKVSVREKSGRGRVEIEFYSSEERERIIELLKSIA